MNATDLALSSRDPWDLPNRTRIDPFRVYLPCINCCALMWARAQATCTYVSLCVSNCIYYLLHPHVFSHSARIKRNQYSLLNRSSNGA